MLPGRPSTYSEEIAAAICERMANGESLREICSEDAFPPESTVRGWAVDDVDGFSARYTRATQIRAAKLFDEIVEIADTQKSGVKTTTKTDAEGNESVDVVEADMLEHRRLQVDARKWVVARMHPKMYGDRQDVAHSGTVNLTISKDDEKL